MPDQQQTGKKYVGTPGLCARWNDCSVMTLERKLKNDPDFPRPIQLTRGGHRLWDLQEIEAYERMAAARSSAAKAKRPQQKAQRRRAGSGARS
jgi:hypothetical protein